ncbi:hypothetical protein [Caldalkalibacillus salinus]|uniref:hypothetical protein n=1 Tax=Caldalkalibacillus salinus TaxID=2803787 RepID=UPI001922EC90|nr:hypothetical protein [Caldalkalibacillus salinus]
MANQSKDNSKINETAFGLSQKQLITLFVLKQLRYGHQRNANQLFNLMEQALPFKRRSRMYVYQTLKGMHRNGTVAQTKSGRSYYYAITSKGEQDYQHFLTLHLQRFETIKKILDMMLEQVIHPQRQKAHALEMTLSEEDRKFVSRVINVRDLVRYLTLRELQQHPKGIHGGHVYRYIKDCFVWYVSEGYFYDVLRRMENPQKYDPESVEFSLVYSTWADPDTRSHRNYFLNQNGKAVFSTIESNLTNELRDVHRYINSILSLLSTS